MSNKLEGSVENSLISHQIFVYVGGIASFWKKLHQVKSERELKTKYKKVVSKTCEPMHRAKICHQNEN